jgi:hypothetical protein
MYCGKTTVVHSASPRRIWLTLCNSLRLDHTVLSVNHGVHLARQYSVVKHPGRYDESTYIPVDRTPFMCVMTGQECAGDQRCDVSYKLLLQDWFQQVAQLQEESDRLQALDSIPPTLRRANPNITREYYLRMRSQVWRGVVVCVYLSLQINAPWHRQHALLAPTRPVSTTEDQ